MKRTILFLSLALAALSLSAQTERKDSVAGNLAPQFKIGRLPVEVDFGPLARKVLERAIFGRRNDGPIIMPPGR